MADKPRPSHVEIAWASGVFSAVGNCYAMQHRDDDGKAHVHMDLIHHSRPLLLRFQAAIGGLGRLSIIRGYDTKVGHRAMKTRKWENRSFNEALRVMGILWHHLDEDMRQTFQGVLTAYGRTRGWKQMPGIPGLQEGRLAEASPPRAPSPSPSADLGNDPTALPGQRKLPGVLDEG